MPRRGPAEPVIPPRRSNSDLAMPEVRTFRSFAAGANLCSQLPHFRKNRKLSVVRALEGVAKPPLTLLRSPRMAQSGKAGETTVHLLEVTK
jgi:hypothetical protein